MKFPWSKKTDAEASAAVPTSEAKSVTPVPTDPGLGITVTAGAPAPNATTSTTVDPPRGDSLATQTSTVTSSPVTFVTTPIAAQGSVVPIAAQGSVVPGSTVGATQYQTSAVYGTPQTQYVTGQSVASLQPGQSVVAMQPGQSTVALPPGQVAPGQTLLYQPGQGTSAIAMTPLVDGKSQVPADYAMPSAEITPKKKGIAGWSGENKRRLAFGVPALVFLITGIIGMGVTWHYGYAPPPSQNQWGAFWSAALLAWLSLCVLITVLVGSSNDKLWFWLEIFFYVLSLALSLAMAALYGSVPNGSRCGWAVAIAMCSIVGLVAVIFTHKTGWYDPNKPNGIFKKAGMIAYRVIVGIMCVASVISLCMLLAGASQQLSSTRAQGDPAGRSFTVKDINNANVNVRCEGPIPVVGVGYKPPYWIEAQMGATLYDWIAVQQILVQAGRRVCIYDRLGYGYSSLPDVYPRSMLQQVRELRSIIDRVSSDPNNGLTRPFYIVGHQLGGQLAGLYAQNFPGDVSGISFVNSVPVDVAFAGTIADPLQPGALTTAKNNYLAELDSIRGFYGPGGMLKLKWSMPPNYAPGDNANNYQAFYLNDENWNSQYFQFQGSMNSDFRPNRYPDTMRILSVTSDTDPNSFNYMYMKNYTTLNNNILNHFSVCPGDCSSTGLPYQNSQWIASELNRYLP